MRHSDVYTATLIYTIHGRHAIRRSAVAQARIQVHISPISPTADGSRVLSGFFGTSPSTLGPTSCALSKIGQSDHAAVNWYMIGGLDNKADTIMPHVRTQARQQEALVGRRSSYTVEHTQ